MNDVKGLKHKILFVCLGNICRSPAAEAVFKHYVERAGRADEFFIDSAGINGYHTGEKADSRMRSCASVRAYNITSRSRRISPLVDYDKFDMIIAMDDTNVKDLRALAPDDEARKKISKMTDYCTHHPDTFVPDPYYGGEDGFIKVLDLLEDGAEGLFSRFI